MDARRLGLRRSGPRRDGSVAAAAAIWRGGKDAPFGACASGAGTLPVRAKASNRIGAAALRPTSPGTGGTIRPPDPDADRDAAVEADRPGVAIAVAGAGLERDALCAPLSGGGVPIRTLPTYQAAT